MNKVQNGSSCGREKFKIPCFLEALLQGLRWFSYIILLDSGGRELRGLVLPCRPVVVDQPLLAAGPLCPGNSFSSTATASEAGAVSQPAPLCWGGSPLLPLFPLVLLLRLGWSHIRLLGSPVAVFWAILALQSATTTTAPSRPQQQLRDRSNAPSTASSSQQQLLVHWPRLLAVVQAGRRSGQQPPPL